MQNFIHKYGTLLNREHATEGLFSSGVLWEERTRFALDSRNRDYTHLDLESFERKVGPFLPTTFDTKCPPFFGRLGMVLEGGGKRRIFAIGMYVKQLLLRPIHDWAMTLLRDIPCDGTYNQTAPLRYLVGKSKLFSFDLSSATDRRFYFISSHFIFWSNGLTITLLVPL